MNSPIVVVSRSTWRRSCRASGSPVSISASDRKIHFTMASTI